MATASLPLSSVEHDAEERSRNSIISRVQRLDLASRSRKFWNTRHSHSMYQALDKEKKEIRLLRLRAGQGDEPLRCALQQAFLNSSPLPRYRTISYCWGDPKARKSVILNGLKWFVPANTKAALQCMRLPDADRVVWIDAICIDQDDPEERGHQIGMMYDIYSNTQENLIYLGEDGDTAAQAKEELNKLLESARRETDDYKTWHRVVLNDNGGRKYSKSGIDVNVDFSPLIQFYSAPWFGRLWVVQEAVLSPKNTWHCGRVVGDMAEALRSAEWLEHKTYHLPFNTPADSGIFRATRVHFYCNSSPKRSYGLNNLVGDLHAFRFSEPRDQIYAVMGLHRKLTGTTSLADQLTPNYQKPLSDVLRDATRYMIRERGDLEVLNCLNCYPCDANLGQSHPSWAPHWHMEKDDDSTVLWGPLSADSPPQLDVGVVLGNDDANQLTLQGYIVDHVSDISSVAHKKNLLTSKGCLCILEEIQTLLANTPIKVDSRVLGATLIAGENASQERATDNDCADFLIWADYIKEKGQLPPNIIEVNQAPGKYDITTAKASAYDQAFYWATVNRRFFITPSGYIGLGPRTMQVSDTVAILYGCRWPVILRSQGDHYTIRGICYVYGIMDGEKVREFEAEGKRLEVIVLH